MAHFPGKCRFRVNQKTERISKWEISVSSGRTRTYNPSVNSRPSYYRPSFPGNFWQRPKWPLNQVGIPLSQSGMARKSQASAWVHLPDPVFSRVINRSGSLGSKWKVSREGVVTGLRALRAAILCRTSSSLGLWAEATVVALGTNGVTIIASIAIRLAEFLLRRDWARTKSLIALFDT
jgi:hypothetical protein